VRKTTTECQEEAIKFHGSAYASIAAGKEEKIKILSRDLEFAIEKIAFSPADFNKDGKVDNADLELITSLLGVKRGGQNYNFRCDMDRNGAIDTTDLTMFAKYLNMP